MATDLSAKFSRVTHEIADFMGGARDYWSTHTLMEGYGEVAKGITDLVEDATRHADPLTQSLAGSGLGVGKLMGAIPIGLYHWGIETLRATKFHGIAGGFKTLLGTPIEGFVEGGKFVLSQTKRWSGGEISNSTFGVADEVATTLGTAVLMFCGLKAIHTGGTGLINGLKNIELSTPAFATDTGPVMPVAIGSEGIMGGGPLATGLVFMSSSKNSTEDPSSTSGQGGRDIKKLAEEAITDKDALTALKYFAKKGDPAALGGLIDLAKKDSFKSITNLKDLAEGGLDAAVDGISQIFLENSDSFALHTLLELAEKRGSHRAIQKIMEMDLETALSKTEPLKPIRPLKDHVFEYTSPIGHRVFLGSPLPDYRVRILKVKALGGDSGALQALGDLGKTDPFSAIELQDFFTNYNKEIDISIRINAFEIFKQLPDNKAIARHIAQGRVYRNFPVEMGTRVLDWLINQSLEDPSIAEAVTSARCEIWNPPNPKIAAIYESVDYRALAILAEYDSRFKDLLQFVLGEMKENDGSPAKIAELQNKMDNLKDRVKEKPPSQNEGWLQKLKNLF